MGNTDKLKEAADAVLGEEKLVKDFWVSDNSVFANFAGRRGCLWQAQMDFDDDGNVLGVNSHGSQTPGQLAREISRKLQSE